MDIRKAIATSVILSTVSSCSVARQELRHSGGYPGYRMDTRLFNSNGSKKIQLLRLTMILALASRVATATIRDGQEAEAFLTYLRNATSEVNYLAAHLYGQAAVPPGTGTPHTPLVPARYSCDYRGTPLPMTPEDHPGQAECATYDTLFESDLPQLEYKIMRLVMAALPREQAAAFARSARSGNVAAAAWNFLKLAAASVDGLHRGAAVHRTNMEILRSVIDHPENCADSAGDPTRMGRVEQAVICSGRTLEQNLFARPGQVNWLSDDKIGTQPFVELFGVIRTSCALLPVTAEAGAATQGNPVQARQEACAAFGFRPTIRPGTSPS